MARWWSSPAPATHIHILRGRMVHFRLCLLSFLFHNVAWMWRRIFGFDDFLCLFLLIISCSVNVYLGCSPIELIRNRKKAKQININKCAVRFALALKCWLELANYTANDKRHLRSRGKHIWTDISDAQRSQGLDWPPIICCCATMNWVSLLRGLL